MRSLRWVVSLIAVAGIAWGPSLASAVIIDDFQSPSTPVGVDGTLAGTPPPPTFIHSSPPGTIIGTQREMDVFRTLGGNLFTGSGVAIGQSIPTDGNDGLLFASGTNLTVTLTYDGTFVGPGFGTFAPVNLLSQGPGLQFDFLSLNSGDDADTQVDITIDANGSSHTFSGMIPSSAGGPTIYTANFADFTGSLADFASVRSIFIQFNGDGEAATDFFLSQISVQQVPEPSSIGIWVILAVAALGATAWAGLKQARGSQPQ